MGRPTEPVVEVYLAGAEAILAALEDPAVAAAWNAPSVLEGQAVSGLAGHLTRNGTWLVGEYLDGEPPTGPPDFTSAAAYYAFYATRLTNVDHAGIRDRGAEVGAVGREELAATARERLAVQAPRLRAEPPDRLVAVSGRNVMPLDAYLGSRVVEQVVHLDDLARSVGVAPWPLPEGAWTLATAIGAEIGRLRHGGPAMVRTLYRTDPATGPLPVL